MLKVKKTLKEFLSASMINCKDTSMLIIKHQENALTFVEKIKMYFHVYVACKLCRLFYKQSNELHEHIQKISKDSHAGNISYQLSDEQKSNLQNIIVKESEGR